MTSVEPRHGGEPTPAPLGARAWQYLAAHRVARLATVDAAGVPSAIPICYASDGQAIYSALDAKPKRVAPARLKRVRNILARPDVALVVDDYSEDWTQLTYLLIHGRAELLDVGGQNHAIAVALLRARYVQYHAMAIDAEAVICIHPSRASFWAAGSTANGGPANGSS